MPNTGEETIKAESKILTEFLLILNNLIKQSTDKDIAKKQDNKMSKLLTTPCLIKSKITIPHLPNDISPLPEIWTRPADKLSGDKTLSV